MTDKPVKPRWSAISTKSIGIFNLFMASAITVSMATKTLWAPKSIFVPFGTKIIWCCEPILVALAVISGIGCLKRLKLCGRVLGSLFSIAVIVYYSVTSIASLKLAWTPVARIIVVEGMVGPTIVYGTVLFFLNTRLKSTFEVPRHENA